MAPEKEKQSRMGVTPMLDNKQPKGANGLDVIKPVEKKAKPKTRQQKPPVNVFSGLRNAFIGMFPSYKSPDEIRGIEATKKKGMTTATGRSTSPPVVQNGVEMSATEVTTIENGVADPVTTDAPTVKDSPAKTKPKADTAAVVSPGKDKPKTTESIKIQEKSGNPLIQSSPTAGASGSSAVDESHPGKTPKKKRQTKQKQQTQLTSPKTPVEPDGSQTAKPSGTASESQLGEEIIADDVLLESVKIAQQGVDGNIADFEIDSILVEDMPEETVASQSASVDNPKVVVAEEKMDPIAVAEAARKAVESYTKAASKDDDTASPKDSVVQSEPSPEETTSLPLVDFSTLNMKQLKLELGSRNLKKGGKKAELIARLEAHENGETTDSTSASSEFEDSSYAAMKVAELKKILKTRGMKVSGKKTELISRLERADAHDSTFEPVVPQDPDADSPLLDYSSMTVALLRSELKQRGLSQRGRKVVLISRLEENDKTVHGSSLDVELPPLEPEVHEDIGFDGSIEDLAKAARDAAQKFQTESPEPADIASPFGGNDALVDDEILGSSLDNPVFTDSMTDWSKYSIGALRTELASRGLGTRGSKIELIASLETSDLQAMMDGPAFDQSKDTSPLLDEIDFENYDIEALSNAAKDAVLQFEAADEPTDEALWEIENEMDSEKDFEIPEDILQMATTEVPPIAAPDYESMAVSQLKAELKSRGLRVTGKKVDLIARLQESD